MANKGVQISDSQEPTFIRYGSLCVVVAKVKMIIGDDPLPHCLEEVGDGTASRERVERALEVQVSEHRMNERKQPVLTTHEPGLGKTTDLAREPSFWHESRQ